MAPYVCEACHGDEYKLLDVANSGFFDCFHHPMKSWYENAYLVSVRDKAGEVWHGRALVGSPR